MMRGEAVTGNKPSGYRPTYETPSDRARELEVLGRVARFLGADIKKLAPKHAMDAVAMRNGIAVGWIEVKTRTTRMGQYPTFYLSLGKVLAARALKDATGLPAIVAVQWTDALAYAPLDDVYPVIFTGRRDRGDSQDLEPQAEIALDKFSIIERREQ
jgi:hypothetical protein